MKRLTLTKKGHIAGCIGMAWGLTVTAPMWLAMLAACLWHSGAPAWAWSVFFCYIPAHLLGVAISAIVKWEVEH